MKTLILILLFFIFSQFSVAQKKFKIDNDCFLLGMFNDYNGREIALDHPFASTQVTSFYCSEKKLEKMFLDSIQKNYHVNDVIVKEDKIYSYLLSKHFNKYYKIKKDKDAGFTYDDIDYSGYIMTLNRNNFLSDEKKISFILGAFLRYGKIKDKGFEIIMANSSSHFDILVWSIKKLGFKFNYKIPCPECIPVSQILYFEPSNYYLSIFQNNKPILPDISDCN
jgi:hypothetical protein